MRISTIKSLGLLVFAGLSAGASAQSFEWAKRAGSYAYDYGRGICTDPGNNVYVTGEFENTGYFNGISVNSRGNHDIFISKYNAAGAIQWVRRAGGSAGDVGHAISADQYGNVYVTGEFQSTADFGHFSIQGGYLNDIFLAKYNTYGAIQWVRKMGGPESDKGFGVADKYGNVYLTGFFQGSATFGPWVLNSNGDKDVFLVKYNSSGTILWAKKFGSNGKDEGRSITIDPSGNVIVAGFFHNTIGFGSVYLTSKGDHDGFVTKFDGNGNVIWARRVAGPYYEIARGVTNDNYGNIYVTGAFCYGASFEHVRIDPFGQGDVFIASYTSSGALRWVKRAGSSLYDEGTCIRSDASGNVYLSGRFSGNAIFGATTLYGSDGEEVFTASLSSSGNFRWAMKAGGSPDQSYSYGEQESGLSIAVDRNANVYTTGAYRTNISFGSTYLSQYYHTDIFVSKIRQSSVARMMEASIRSSNESEGVLLETDAAPGFAYAWYHDGVMVSEANSAWIKVSEKGYYNVMVVNENDTAWSETVLVDPSGVSDNPYLKADLMRTVSDHSAEIPQLNVYPNPAVSRFNLALPSDDSSEEASVELYDISGQMLQSFVIPVESGIGMVGVDEDLLSGVYLIKINTPRKVYHSTVIIRKE